MSAAQKSGSAVIIGSGPGIGRHVAAAFARRGFTKMALLARRAEQLDQDRQFVLSEAAAAAATTTTGTPVVKTYPVDITDLSRFKTVLAQVQADLGAPEFVFFNAARVRPSTLLQFDEEELIQEIMISTAALHVAAKWAMPQLLQLSSQRDSPASSGATNFFQAKPTLLVTSSLLPREPDTDLVVLSASKAAQYNLTQSLARVYGPRGVHVGVVIVGGVVAEDKPVLNPKNIAAETWALYDDEKHPQRWSVELLE